MTSRLWGGVKDIFVGSIMDLLLKSVTIREEVKNSLTSVMNDPLIEWMGMVLQVT